MLIRLSDMGVRRGGQNGHLPPCKLRLRSKNFWKTWNQQFNSFYWVNSCNDSLFADMTLTLHKNQVHCAGSVQLWACSSINPLLCLQRQVAKLTSELFYYWSLLRNNNMVKNLRRCTSSHGSMRFAACNIIIERRYLGR